MAEGISAISPIVRTGSGTATRRRKKILEKSTRSILILGALDTKGREIRYLRERISKSGLQTIVLDNGILGEPRAIVPDISASEVALAAGTTLKKIRRAPTRGAAIAEMTEGCVASCGFHLIHPNMIH